MLTCKKTYTDIPFAHRQHHHDGHCALIHGHNWGISLTFGCKETDENGFVVDFGKLKYLKKWIEANLDHACLLNEDDPLREQIVAGAPEVWNVYVLPNCSCEGLAQHIFEIFDLMIREQTGNRAFILSVEVVEDSKNSAVYAPQRD